MKRFYWWSHTRGGFTLGVVAADTNAACETIRRLDPRVTHWSGQVIELDGEFFVKCVAAGMSELTGKFVAPHCPPFLGTVLTAKTHDPEAPRPQAELPAVHCVPADDCGSADEQPVGRLDDVVGNSPRVLPRPPQPGGQIVNFWSL